MSNINDKIEVMKIEKEKISSITMIQPPHTNPRPVNPNLFKTVIGVGLISLILGVFFVILFEHVRVSR